MNRIIYSENNNIVDYYFTKKGVRGKMEENRGEILLKEKGTKFER